MNIFKALLLILLAVLMFNCERIEDKEEYKRPDWLAGKVYTQVKDNADLSVFAKCIELSGYDTIINVAGSYTVFAPDNNAFTEYLNSKPAYNSVEDMPNDELLQLVKYHIVQNPWSLDQLRSLDIYGWIDTLDLINNKPRGFKRETLLMEEDNNFGASYEEEKGFIIVDSTKAQLKRKVITDSRKYVPVFYSEFFDIYKLGSENYDFYFNRSFDKSRLYYAGAQIDQEEIFAENGFVHVIDKVIEPLPNVYEIMSSKEQGNNYSNFLDLINNFSEFVYNQEQTMEQPGAEDGLDVDSLFNVYYPELTFNILNEKVSYIDNIDYVTIRYHQGIAAPTNNALSALVNEYLVGDYKWGSLEDAPDNIKRIIVNTHMSETPMFPEYLTEGFKNGETDNITISEENIIQKKFGSNATFLGLDQAIVPKAFSSITGPVYLQRRFSSTMLATEMAGLLSALKRENENYTFFVETDEDCNQDSSLLYDLKYESFNLYINGTEQKKSLSVSDLRNLLMNHVGISPIEGIARKEFIKTLSGNFIVVDNETGVVSGTGNTTQGYKGATPVDIIPEPIFDATNGTTYRISDWFTFTPREIFIQISTNYPAFHELIRQAGLSVDQLYEYNFLSESEKYTVFVPTSLALSKYNTDTLTQDELQKFVQVHFIQGNLIFTDGKNSSGYYETTRVDEKSTSVRKVFTNMNFRNSVDQITILNSSGDPYYTIDESETTNMLCGSAIGELTEVYPASLTNGVIHEIDTVLLVNYLDVE